MIVYIDQIFIVNFFADFALLHISSGLVAARRLRYTVLSAIIGALYASAMYIPGAIFLGNIFIKISVFSVMVLVGFRPKSLFMYLKSMIIFGAVSAFFGGGVFGVLIMSGYSVAEIKNSSVVVFNADTIVLVLCFSVVVLLGLGVIKVVGKSLKLKSKTVTVEICHNGKRIFVNGLVDTGCTLNEPAKDRPVIIVDSRYADAFLRMTGNVLMIPYSTVDKKGVFLGFYPDFIKVNKKIVKDVAVAVCYGSTMKDKDYSAIINSEILKEENCFV